MSNINYPKESSFTLSIDSFENGINTLKDTSLTNLNYAIDLHNFSFNSGALENGLGFSDLLSKILSTSEYNTISKDLETVGSIEKIFHFYIFNQETNSRDDKLIFVNHEQKIYYINLYDESKSLIYLRGIQFSSSPTAVRYRLNSEDVMIFSSETDNMVVWNGYNEPYEVLDAPKISSMALHYERLFVTVDKEKNSVWFSDDLDPTNWSLSLEEAGFIDLLDERGSLLKVVSFCDYVYIFREHGISRLSAYGNQENFAVSNLFVSSGKIYANSVCVCGDEIVFLASDGFYKFDGVNTVKILDNISENICDINSQCISSCYYNGCYFLACKFSFKGDNDDSDNLFFSNCLLQIDINNHKLKNITHGLNIKYITTINSDQLEGVVALANQDQSSGYYITLIDNSGSFLNKPLNKLWLSPKSGLNETYKHKTLKKIMLQSSGNIYLTIYHDNDETTFFVEGSDKPISIRTNISLNIFAFKIQSNDLETNIKDLKFDFISTDGRL